jgi:hypothetical protein
MARSAERNPGAGDRADRLPRRRPSLAGSIVAGLRVYGGRHELGRIADLTGAQDAADHDARRARLGRPADRRRGPRDGPRGPHVPALTDLLDGTVDAYRVRRVRVEDLLRRPIVTDHVPASRDRPGPDGDDHRRRRLDRLRARPPGLRARAAPAHPRRPRREPAVPAPARARDADRTHGKASGELKIHLANVTNRTGDGRPDLHRGAVGHLPRRGLQARADDGVAPVRRDVRQRRRDDGRPRRGRPPPGSSASCSCPPTRPSAPRA